MTLREKLESLAETGAERQLIEHWLGAADALQSRGAQPRRGLRLE